MKKFCILLSLCLLLGLTGCGSTAPESSRVEEGGTPSLTTAPEPTPEPTATPEPIATAGATQSPAPESFEEPAEPQGGKPLVVYFSWSGNTEQVALEIAGQTEAEVFKIQPETPYTTDYDEMLEIATEEQRENTRPAISGELPDLDGVDTVYLGYPNWWGDMPMILYSYLDAADLTGKTVCPFVTSGGSGLSGTVGTIRELEPGADVTEGLSLGSAEAANCGDAVSAWLIEIGTKQ